MEEKDEINPFLKEAIDFGTQSDAYTAIPKEKGKGNKLDLYQNWKYDRQPSNKLYAHPRLKKFIYELTSGDYKLLMYILIHLRKGEDVIELNLKKVIKEIGVSERTFKSSRKKFQELDIIARKKKSWEIYYVNPHYIFGNARYNKLEAKYGEEALLKDDF